MELKQLEFFVTANECGSLGKAASKLYTSQPNVSKTIRLLEEELGEQLFERTPRGLRLTEYGNSIYKYAKDAIQNANLIKTYSVHKSNRTFRISTYPSNSMAQLLVSQMLTSPELQVECRQGTVEEITSQVASGISEIGILYISRKHKQAFQNMISQKKIGFMELARRKTCIYVGPHSPYYERTSISLSEIATIRFMRELEDFFSMENGLETLNFGAINPDMLHHIISTNSERVTKCLLTQTDLAYLGISLNLSPVSNDYAAIHELYIEEEDTELLFGFIYEKERLLSKESHTFIQNLQHLLNP